jgi:hypothetical protein
VINTDKEFKSIVRNIANGSSKNREVVLEVAGYLWDNSNWKRLAETAYGRFLREVHNKCPDYTLLSLYRKEVLQYQK